MDWSRAKTILIISFLLLNGLLGYQLWYDRVTTDSDNAYAIEDAEVTEQIMASRNIGLLVDIPKETPRLRELTANIAPAQGVPETVKLPTPFSIQHLDNDQSALMEVMAEQIPDAESYQLSRIDSANNVYVFHQKQGVYPLFDVKLELLAQGGTISSYRQSHAEIVGVAGQKESKVLSGMRAVGILAEKLESGSNIVDVRLGYHGQVFNSETRVLLPYWRIVTDRGERFYVHAITGAVE
jgi:regulatory protein YycI of two-component signal transduction system YycFG